MDVSKRTIDHLVNCSYLSPLLMQGLCEQLCQEQHVYQTSPGTVHIDLRKRDEVGELAGRFAKPLTRSFDAILDGACSQEQENQGRARSFASEVLVLGVSHTRPFQALALSDIIARLEQHVLQKPVAPNLSALLVQKAREIQRKFGGERGDRSPIYYDQTNKTLTIVDPYFKLWARWVRGGELGGRCSPVRRRVAIFTVPL